MKSAAISAAFLAATAYAAPAAIEKRANIDGVILNYALTLEHLEAAFYKAAIAQFKPSDFEKAGFGGLSFYNKIARVANDEATHVAVLQNAIAKAGGKAVKPCTYSFPYTNAASFVNLAGLIEGVGVSAYLGAAASVTDKTLLTAAASILTIEARHNTFIRNAKGLSPFPQAFDTPLDFDQVYTLAAAFIETCPTDNPALPVKAFPILTSTSASPMKPGEDLTLVYGPKASIPDGDLYIAFPTLTAPFFVKVKSINKAQRKVTITLPADGVTGPAGEVFALLTASGTELTDANTIAGPAIVQIIT